MSSRDLCYINLMRKISETLILFVILISIALVSYVIYEQISKIAQYKKTVLGVTSNYLALQKQYDSMQEKTKNLKKIIISSKDENSKTIKIGDIIQQYVKKTNGDISIYYKNLTTEEEVVINGDEKYYMASLYKVILTLFILDKIINKELSLSDTIGDPKITVEKALDKIITESNNEYANLLAEEYGWQEIAKNMKGKLGIEFTFNEKLEISAKNVGFLFEDILMALKIPDLESGYILKLLGNQKKLSKLPKYLPSNIYSHNKTGEFEEYSHDAGIFYTPKANYILVFMSRTQNPGITNEEMALMSKDIYESLNATK